MATLAREVLIKHSADQLSSDLGEEVIILNLRNGVYYGLDGAGALVWSLLATTRTLAELASAMEAKFTVDADRSLADVTGLVLNLEAEGLVELSRVEHI